MKSMLSGLGKTMIAAFSVAALVSFGKQAISTASDLAEAQNVVDTAFGDMAYKMEDFAKNSIQSFGISKLAAKQTGSTFMAMGRGMGIAMGASSDMAVSLTGLSADMSSFYNVSQDVASTALKSIFTGETESLKQFGIVMTQANLQAFAYSKGIKQNVSDLDQASITQLRYQYVMQQTSLAQGDFAKTSGSWANQTRMLSENWKNFMSILGSGLIQILIPVVRFLNTALNYLTQLATTVGGVLSSVFNLGSATGTTAKNTAAIATGSDDASAGLGKLGKSAKKAGKDANSGTSSFDKLNNMTENVADSSSDAADNIAKMGGGSIGVGITPTVDKPDTKALETGISAVMVKLKGVLSQFNNWLITNFAPIFSKIWTDLQPCIGTFKNTVSKMFTDMQTLGQPLLDYLKGPFTTYLKQYITTAGVVIVGLLDSFNMVFSDIWDVVVFPVLESFIKVGLPMITDFTTQYIQLFEVVFDETKGIFDLLWKEAVKPVLELITKVWTDLMKLFSDTWNKWGKPIFDNLKAAVKNTGDIFVAMWKNFLKPVFDTLMQVADKLWDKHLKPLLANFLDFVGELVNGALEIYNKFIAPLVKWFVENFGPPIAKIISGLIKNIGEFLGGIIDAVIGIITALKGIVQFITGVFTGDWKKAWTGVQNIFKGIFDALVGIVRAPVNLIIDIINGMVSGIVTGINTVIKAVNGLSFELPKALGGFKVGFNIPTITTPKIPKLATGTVVPANYGNFLATLGDNRREPEIVSPLSTMKQALIEALQSYGRGTCQTHLTIQLGAKTFYDEMVKIDKDTIITTGKSGFAY